MGSPRRKCISDRERSHLCVCFFFINLTQKRSYKIWIFHRESLCIEQEKRTVWNIKSAFAFPFLRLFRSRLRGRTAFPSYRRKSGENLNFHRWNVSTWNKITSETQDFRRFFHLHSCDSVPVQTSLKRPYLSISARKSACKNVLKEKRNLIIIQFRAVRILLWWYPVRSNLQKVCKNEDF